MNEPKYEIPRNPRRGKCENCGFAGLLVRKAMMPTNADAALVAATYDQELPVLSICPTCDQTPAGTKSENQLHKRLEAEEYTK